MKGGVCTAILLIAGVAARAEEPVTVDKVFTVIHERPRATMRDPLLFVRRNIGTRERSCAWFSVRADYSQFRYRDQFCERRDAGVIGLKAVINF
jgi:hypothetical protein